MKLPGDIVQRAITQTGAVASGTTAIPDDDTIPQNTEGDQLMTQAITPVSAVNILVIDAEAQLSSTGTSDLKCLALFQDTTANALKAARSNNDAANITEHMKFSHTMIAATTSSTTFKIRAGGVAGTLTFNGVSAARKLGGVLASMLCITEYMG